MSFDIKGKIHTIFEPKQVSDRFRKCDFVVEVEDGKYPQLVSFQIVNDKIAQLAELDDGDEVSVTFNVRGREWTSPSGEVKYFNTLDAWKVESLSVAPPRQQATSGGGYGAPPSSGGPEDDIPFLSCDLAHEPSPIARVLR